jgi:hypothetical protein
VIDPAPVSVSSKVDNAESTMAEIGLVRFARVALEVAEAVLPDYPTKFSKHTFTQPQLLAILCLIYATRSGPPA